MGKAVGPSADEEEAQITFVKAGTKRTRTIPVWFTLYQGKLELLPMYGLKTKWYEDVKESGRLSLQVKDWRKEGTPKAITGPNAIDEIKRRFSAKYGEVNVKRYYSSQDIALEIPF